MADRFYVYILTNRPKGVLYVGATNNLVRRVGEHKGKYVPGFTADHGLTRLVYFEEYSSILEARARERAIKRWARAWKFEIIEKQNPDWLDLSDQLALQRLSVAERSRVCTASLARRSAPGKS